LALDLIVFFQFCGTIPTLPNHIDLVLLLLGQKITPTGCLKISVTEIW